MRQDARQL